MSTAMLRQPEQARPVRLAAAPFTPSPNERPGRGPAFAYVVRPGDALPAIARASGVPIAELMRRNPSMHPNFLRPGDRLWVPDLLPASAGEPAIGLAARSASGGEVRMSADRRFVAVLDSTVDQSPNSLVVLERKTGKKISVPLTSAGHVWKKVGWSTDGRLLAIEGLRSAKGEGGDLIAFDPLTGEKTFLLASATAQDDLQQEGRFHERVEVVSFRPVKDRITYRLALRDEPGERALYAEWVMNFKGQERRRA
ncbi:MAG: LysM peptidoglycan-binding domain-containing protein [Cyanobacteria bacterium REEB65]|nr:LysM peptidoglycan-binding domain-containing protein [Cyanobacteria bacterium REEB65]